MHQRTTQKGTRVKKLMVTTPAAVAAAAPTSQRALSKVPEVTLVFWLIKILSTTVGETGADLLTYHFKWGLLNTSYAMTGLLLVALVVQFKVRAYVPAIYWLVVVLVSIVGTLITDTLVDLFRVPLIVTTGVFVVLLPATFTLWFARERTLSIHSIVTPRREAFYWLAILCTFALGTAAGDLLAEGLAWGYLNSAVIFAALIGLVALAYYQLKLNAVLAFWLAYILTRPFGAALGDELSQPHKLGGLGFGSVRTSVVFGAVIFGLVVYLTRSRSDVMRLPLPAVRQE
jgi:uncharacterized membrane-anchored protein